MRSWAINSEPIRRISPLGVRIESPSIAVARNRVLILAKKEGRAAFWKRGTNPNSPITMPRSAKRQSQREDRRRERREKRQRGDSNHAPSARTGTVSQKIPRPMQAIEVQAVSECLQASKQFFIPMSEPLR